MHYVYLVVKLQQYNLFLNLDNMKIFWKEIEFRSPISLLQQAKAEPVRFLKNLNRSWWWREALWVKSWNIWAFKVQKKALYRIKKVNSDVNQCIDMRANNTALNWLTLINKSDWEVADHKENKKYYDYIKQLFQAGTEHSWTFKLFKSDVFCDAIINGCLFLEPMYWLWGDDWMSWPIRRFDVLSGRNTRCVYKKGKLIWFQNGRWFGMWWDAANFKAEDLGYFIYNRDPENKHSTMWLLEWIFYDILQDLEQTKAGWSYYQNGIFPWMVFMLDERMTTEEQEKLSQDINKMYWWAEWAGKRVMWNGIKDMKEVHINIKDLDLINSRHFNTEKVCSALWTDKRIIWYEWDNWNRAERNGLIRQRYEMTIQPDEERLKAVLNWVLQQFQSRLELPDLVDKFEVWVSSINVNDTTEQTKLWLQLYTKWAISLDEMRETSGREKLDNERSSKHYIPSNMIEVWLQEERNQE